MGDTICKSSEFIPSIIEGLFGLTTIMLAVFSLISNDVTKKTSGFSLISLRRYKVKYLLSPIYLVFLISIIMMIFSEMNKGWFLIVGTLVTLSLVTFQSYLILQPLYKENKCKQAMIKTRANNFKKKIKKAKKNNQIEKILNDEETEIFNSISLDNVENKYILFDDKKSIYRSYVGVIENELDDISDDIYIRFIKIGLNIFGDEFVNISNEYNFPEILMLDVFLNENQKYFNMILHQKNLRLIHTLFESYKNGTPIEECYTDGQMEMFFLQTVMNSEAINFVVDYIFDTDEWSFSDSAFIKVLLTVFSNSYSRFTQVYKLYLDELKYKKFEEIMISFKTKKELTEELTEFQKRFNLIIKTLKEE